VAHPPLHVIPGTPAGGRARLWKFWQARAGLGAWLATRLLEENTRWILWLPVGLGLGIGVYFALPIEPPVWLGPIALLAPAAAVGLRWRGGRPVAAELAVWFGLGTIVLGFAAGSVRSHLVAAPVLERRGAYQLEATVLLVEDGTRGQRLLLGEPSIEGIAASATPARIRVSTRRAEPSFEPGDRVRLRAHLMAPSPPVEPHGFDFARQAWFEGLGAVGYALVAPELLSRADRRGWSLGLAALRQTIAHEIVVAVPGAAGAIGVALLTGLRGALPDRIWDEWAIAGIAHLISISGLHMAIVAGTLLFAVRIGLALAPPLALRLPAKKLAALIALLGICGYLLISGGTVSGSGSVPIQRSFAMSALALVAIMVDRNPISMRLVAWAALAVLLLRPESLLGASFQMSFGAVVALIATYETGIGRHPSGAAGLDWRLLMYVAGIALTTVVASAATTPFSIYHFSRFPTYGVVTNLIAVPLTAIWVMPWGMLGMLLIPIGLGGPCFALMGRGIEVIIAAAAFVAELPGAALAVPRPPLVALVATVLGGLWLCLWRTSWRRFGLLGVALGIGLMLVARPPDILIDSRGEILAVRLDDGRLALSPWKRDRWITDSWLESAGQVQAAGWPAAGQGAQNGLACDAEGCVLSRHGKRVALARRPEALEADCARADLVISYPRAERCRNGTPLIGPEALRPSGGIALRVGADGIDISSVRAARGDRPWTR
jgi:competence protein ComEC